MDYELRVLLAVAGRRPPMQRGDAYRQALEVLVGFGFIEPSPGGAYVLTPEGIELADSIALATR